MRVPDDPTAATTIHGEQAAASGIDPPPATDVIPGGSAPINRLDAYAELWRMHHLVVIHAVRAVTSFDAEEITQEAFTRVLERLCRHEDVKHLRAYLIQTAKNIAIDLSRRRDHTHTRAAEPSEIERALASRDLSMERAEQRQAVLTAYDSIPIRHQQVLWLKDVEDLTITDCAAAMRVSESAATSLLRRARSSFKHSWVASHLPPHHRVPEGCSEVVGLIPKFHLDTLEEDPRVAVERHLELCEPCDTISREAEAVAASLTRSTCTGAVPARKQTAVRRTVRSRPASRRPRR